MSEHFPILVPGAADAGNLTVEAAWDRSSITTVGTGDRSAGFDEFENEADRRYYKLLPTSFSLSDKEVDGLRDAGRSLLRASKEFQDLVEALQ